MFSTGLPGEVKGHTCVIVLTSLMSIATKWDGHMTINVRRRLRRLLWISCPRHAGGKGNNLVERLDGKAVSTNGFCLQRSEVLRSLRHCYLRAQSRRYHTYHRLEERKMQRGSAWPRPKARERAIINKPSLELSHRPLSLGKPKKRAEATDIE